MFSVCVAGTARKFVRNADGQGTSWVPKEQTQQWDERALVPLEVQRHRTVTALL
jgi:hypothetical protein